MGWLERAEEGAGVFETPSDLDPVLDAFEARMAGEIDHPAFTRLGSVTVKRDDVERLQRVAHLERIGALAVLQDEVAQRIDDPHRLGEPAHAGLRACRDRRESA